MERKAQWQMGGAGSKESKQEVVESKQEVVQAVNTHRPPQ